MQLKIKIELTDTERRVVKRVLLKQINALNTISQGGAHEDVEMECIKFEVSKEDFFNAVRRNLKIFEEAYDNPENILSLLDEEHISIIKHILFNIKVKSQELNMGKRKVWDKLTIWDNINHYSKSN